MDNKILWIAGGVGVFLLMQRSGTANPLTKLLSPSTPSPQPINTTGPIVAVTPNPAYPTAKIDHTLPVVISPPVIANPVAQTQSYPYLLPGAPTLPAQYNQQYYEQWIRPAMIQANPNVNNPGYTLTPTEANQYLANYLAIQQWVPNVLGDKAKFHSSPTEALIFHWKTYGVADKNTFLPLIPPNVGNWGGPAPINPNAKSGGSFLDTLGKITSVASTLISFLGADDDILNDKEVEVLFQGAAIMKDIVPLYRGVAPAEVALIMDRLDTLLQQYTRNM